MESFSEKVFLQLQMPAEESPISDQKRIQQALQELGYENITIPVTGGNGIMDWRWTMAPPPS